MKKNQKNMLKAWAIFKEIAFVLLAIILFVLILFFNYIFLFFIISHIAWKIMLCFLLVWSLIVIFIYKKLGWFMAVSAWLLFFCVIVYGKDGYCVDRSDTRLNKIVAPGELSLELQQAYIKKYNIGSQTLTANDFKISSYWAEVALCQQDLTVVKMIKEVFFESE